MNLNLKGKVILISGGIDSSISNLIKLLIDEEAVPVVTGTFLYDEAEIINTCFSVETDLANADNCKTAIEKVVNKFGKIDGLINIPIHAYQERLTKTEPLQFIDNLQQNFVPYFLLTQHALPYLKITKGTIVNVIPTANNVTAGADGFTALTREWAVELVKYNIRVNAALFSVDRLETTELANMVIFLLSERSSHITGQFIHINKPAE